jgi:hypothetical protein
MCACGSNCLSWRKAGTAITASPTQLGMRTTTRLMLSMFIVWGIKSEPVSRPMKRGQARNVECGDLSPLS